MFRVLLFILSFNAINCVAQTIVKDIPIGTWRDHLPYNDAVSVSAGGDIIYAATSSAIFTYDKSDGTIERLNLVNGLSDIGISKIKYNEYNSKLIIAYTNGNLDVLDTEKNITNLSFIRTSSVSGSKSINHIYLLGKLAYLSTGFGIVVLDTDKLEIIDTYLFGPLGGYINTNAITFDQNNIYAATDEGIYFADKSSSNLINYNEWSLLNDLGTKKYSDIVYYSNRLFASFDSPIYSADTVYYNDQGLWQKFLPNGSNINEINVSRDHLFINFNNTVLKYDNSLTNIKGVYHFKQQFNISPQETVLDNEGFMIIAEESHGILRVKDSWSGENITTNGPTSANAYKMAFVEEELWMVSGGINPNNYSPSGINKNLVNYRQAGEWKSVGEKIENINGFRTSDAVSVAVNPSNKSQVFFGTWDNGLFELKNGVVSNILTAQNSVLDSTFFGSTKVGGLAFDKNNNLWTVSGFASNQLAVKTPSNDWYTCPFTGSGFTSGNVFTDIIITQDDYKWIMEPRANSIAVYSENGTINNSSDFEGKTLSPSTNKIPGSRLNCLVEDLDGEIWIGTDEGLAVFYNPSNVFDEDIEAERIYIQQDGQTQILLETEFISVIEVDGANRKWIGTQNSGVFLMNEDGTEEIEHFTTENSPLFSNNIFDIVIDPKTGEIFFGTEKGVLSYKGTATDPDTDFNNVFIYPNPVKPDFTGTIGIRGLVKDTDVRITDISGNIVFQTTSLGGQAVWDGKDFNGNKVQTGVYMVFNGSPEGELKAVAKILFIH
jgi:ligand-binding sensor domain-containing protein